MATVKEINAAFDVISADIKHMIDEKAPFMFKNKIMEVFDSTEGRQALVDMITKGLEAAEKVREAK